MSFEKYRNKADKKWFTHRYTRGESSQEERNRFYQLYMAYNTNKLVWATWGLAIGTLILSGLTIYFQYLK